MLYFETRMRWMFCLSFLLTCSGCSWIGGASKSYDQQVAEGRSLYELNGCATCHGTDGRGDGPVTKAMNITPRDFHNPESFINGYSADKIAGSIATGVAEPNQSMPPYPHLSSSDRQLLAIYIRSLGNDSKNGATP
jgi:mono/diheme cytochrome c family protein